MALKYEYFKVKKSEKSTKDLEPFVKVMYRKLEPFEVLTYQVLSSSKIASPGPIYLI